MDTNAITTLETVRRKKAANETEPSAMPKYAINNAEKKLAKGRLARMSQNWHCNRGLLGHPVLWTQEEAITAMTLWTNASLEREAIWPQTKHNVPLGDNTCILMASSHFNDAKLHNVLLCWAASGQQNCWRSSISQSFWSEFSQTLCSGDLPDAHCGGTVDDDSWISCPDNALSYLGGCPASSHCNDRHHQSESRSSQLA